MVAAGSSRWDAATGVAAAGAGRTRRSARRERPRRCAGSMPGPPGCRSPTDHGHGGDPVRAALARPAVRPAPPPARAQRPGWQLAGQAAELRAVDRLVDRLAHDMPRRLARELGAQRPHDLLRAPPLLQPALHELAQRLVAGDLARPKPGPPLSSQLVRGERPVPPAARVTVTPQLAADRRRAAAQPFRDRPHPGPRPGAGPR